jgi:glycosyltransferase involved in cell wall biosynthesis
MHAMPAMAPREFQPEDQPQDRVRRGRYGLSEPYVLADGETPEGIDLLLASWTWVFSTMGDSVALRLLGPRRAEAFGVRRRAEDLGLEASVRVIEEAKLEDLPAIYRGAEAFLFAGWGRAGDAVQRALASGKAIVGVENPEAASLLGPAGYLVKGRDARLLGAACITVLAEPEMRERLRGRARERGVLLTQDAPLQALLGHLEEVACGAFS